MVGLTFLADSALLRAERAVEGDRGGVASTLARAYAFGAVDRARVLAAAALRRIPGGRGALGRLHAYLGEHGVDLIGLRREAAAAGLEADGYPLR
jgi:hypothetical protein